MMEPRRAPQQITAAPGGAALVQPGCPSLASLCHLMQLSWAKHWQHPKEKLPQLCSAPQVSKL